MCRDCSKHKLHFKPLSLAEYVELVSRHAKCPSPSCHSDRNEGMCSITSLPPVLISQPTTTDTTSAQCSYVCLASTLFPSNHFPPESPPSRPVFLQTVVMSLSVFSSWTWTRAFPCKLQMPVSGKNQGQCVWTGHPQHTFLTFILCFFDSFVVPEGVGIIM